jgi:hypothetical protein
MFSSHRIREGILVVVLDTTSRVPLPSMLPVGNNTPYYITLVILLIDQWPEQASYSLVTKILRMMITGAITTVPHDSLSRTAPKVSRIRTIRENSVTKTLESANSFCRSERASLAWLVQLIRKHFRLLPYSRLTRLESSARVLNPRFPVSHAATDLCVAFSCANICSVSINLDILLPPR